MLHLDFMWKCLIIFVGDIRKFFTNILKILLLSNMVLRGPVYFGHYTLYWLQAIQIVLIENVAFIEI